MMPMWGAAAMVFVLVIVIPVGVMMSGAVAAAAIGHFVRRDADVRNEGSELLDLNG
jgi:hypothetical protein